MQQWFFLEDPQNALIRGASGDSQENLEEGKEGAIRVIPKRMWLFRARATDLKIGETLCVVGNVEELGGWMPEKCIPLDQEGETGIWSKKISIPDEQEVQYRFCVCIMVDSGIQVIVRNWETHLQSRIVPAVAKSPTKKDEPMLYGDSDLQHHVERGWLNKETTIQIKLFRNFLALWRPRYASRTVFIKVTPVSLIRNHIIPKTLSEALDESLSDNPDTLENPKHAYTEVASFNESECVFEPQGQFGKEYNSGDSLIFQSTVLFPANVALLIDLYIYSSRAAEGDPPYHAGFSYLLPSALRTSTGTLIMPVTSTKQRPLGQIEVEYLVIKPMTNFKCDMSVSYARHWVTSKSSLDVGHRGAGSSFTVEPKNCAEVRENTIASLKTAAEHGADFVEFDVQLSKDLVPIIYHDYHVCISMKKKKALEDGDMLELPVKELTFEQLKLLKVYHLTEGKSKNPRFFDEDLEDHQPFPSLQQALEVIDTKVGFNIEIKWPMQMKDGTYELFILTDVNLYLDIILEIVLKYAGPRKIIFSCFQADICTMVRFKQNKYPVLFLTQGDTEKYPSYLDPRCGSIQMAVQHATMLEILGINVHTEDLLKDFSMVKLAKEAGLIIFCWGDDNADKATIKLLKELGLNGIIYDKIYQYKESKESIYMVDAKDSQKDLIRLAAAASETVQTKMEQDTLLDVERARQGLDNISTATSLTSLSSAWSDYNNR